MIKRWTFDSKNVLSVINVLMCFSGLAQNSTESACNVYFTCAQNGSNFDRSLHLNYNKYYKIPSLSI